MERVPRSKAIRLKCLDCCCGQSNEVQMCPCKDCPLWRYRFGYEIDENGNRVKSKELTEEQKKAAAERLKKVRGQ